MKLLRRLLLSLLALVLAAVLAEVYVRRADPYGVSYYRDFDRYLNHAIELVPFREDGRLFRQRPSHTVEFTAFRLHTDPLGLRVPQATEALPEPDERLRVLCLGDSTTLGWGVDDEQTWVRLLEGAARAPDGRAIRVFNAGTNVYDTVQELATLQELGPLLRPEVVLVMVNTNDLDPTLELYRELSEAGLAGAELSSWERLRARGRHAIVSRFLGLHGLVRYLRLKDFMDAVERRAVPLSVETNYPGQMPRVLGALDGIAALCDELGAQLVVLDHTFPEVPDVAQHCAAQSLAFVDAKWTDEEWARPIRLSAVDAHANALGNQLLMEKVLAGLSHLGILEHE